MSEARFKNRVKVSERHGSGEWKIERIALAILVVLGLWVASSAFTLAGSGYEGALGWFASPVNAVLAGLTLVVFFGYISIAWKVIIEDYIHRAGNKALLLGLVNIVCLLATAAGVFFIVRLALGSAPLPAGLGF